jgi:drug/metabolite transporter (DMT)-like permease
MHSPDNIAPARDERRANIRAHAGLLLMTVIWAVNFSIIKVGLASVPPTAFNALRFPLASLTVYVLLRRRGPIPLPSREDAVRLAALGLLGNTIYQICFITGVNNTRAGTASVLLAGTPIITALLSAALGHERPRARVWVGVVATFVGILLVVLGGGTSLDKGSHFGDLIMLAASILWAVYTVGAHPLIERYGSMAVTAWTLWAGTLGLLVIGLPQLLALDFGRVPAAAWGSMAFAGAFGIGVAYPLWYYGVRQIGNTRTATYSNLVPVLAMAFAWLTLGEVPGIWQAVGATVIIAGVTLARRRTTQISV